MGYDAMANGAAAAAPRDIVAAGKKKKANRSAKLKQCKLDARREQWLSQVKNKDPKGTSMVAASPTSPLPPPHVSLPHGRSGHNDSGRRPAEEDRDREEQGLHDSSDSESPTHSPTSSGSEHGSRNGRPSNSIGSGCSIESSSRTGSDAELEDGEEEVVDRGGENGPLDDWEAVADAMSADNDRNLDSSVVSVIRPRTSHGSPEGPHRRPPTKPEPIHPPPRAWRTDDESRPRSLPSLTKQRSFMVEMERQCGLSHTCSVVISSPSMCPICCEELDVTDSNFLPCSCGFRLCLFCHKRILEDDGRCPGCRKQYCLTAGRGMGVGGGGVSIKLSRSCSMRSSS